MNSRSSKKRGGDKSNEIPAKKMIMEVLEAPVPANHDVTIVVKGKRFQCRKEELSNHSNYFERMFNSNFTERNETEVELGIVKPESFDMFLKAIRGEDVVTDFTVERMLALADFLESATLETNCMRHLANRTVFSLAKQFEMAEAHHSERLMRQVCSSIKDAYELNEVVPKDLDSFCNTTKNIVLQRSFEFLGIRKPPSPPLPEEPDQLFEHMMNEIFDQVEIQNHHGKVLKDQIELCRDHIFVEDYIPRFGATQTIRDNHLIKELADELREAHEPEEVNLIRTQIMVLKLKDIYTVFQDSGNGRKSASRAITTANICSSLGDLAVMINQNKRAHRSFRVTLGDREIDRIYREINEKKIRYCQRPHIRDVTNHASWIERIKELNDSLSAKIDKRDPIRRPRPYGGTRRVSNGANFRAINEVVNNMRRFQYRFSRAIQPENNEDDDEDGPDQDADEQNPEEQDQEDN